MKLKVQQYKFIAESHVAIGSNRPIVVVIWPILRYSLKSTVQGVELTLIFIIRVIVKRKL